MKAIDPITPAALILLLLTGLSANASLTQATDPRFGPNSLTIDTSTGLGWLDLTASAGLSYQQVLADTQPGGIFSGFRYATVQEVLHLYSSAGIPGPGYYALSTPAIQTLISLVGPTGSFQGQPEIDGLSATTSMDGLQNVPQIYASGVNSEFDYLVSGPGFSLVSINPTLSSSVVGSWLVTEVPEPLDTSIWVLAASGLTGLRLLQRRQNAA